MPRDLDLRAYWLGRVALLLLAAAGVLLLTNPLFVYAYDAPSDAAHDVVTHAADQARDQVRHPAGAIGRSGVSRYDDRPRLARASPRLDGYRSAPNTTGRFGDDVLALPRGGANLSQQRLDHIVARH